MYLLTPRFFKELAFSNFLRSSKRVSALYVFFKVQRSLLKRFERGCSWPFDNEGWVMSFHHLWVKCNDWYIKWITVASGVHIKNIFFAIILLGLKIVYYKFPYVWKLYELYQWTLYRNELSWPCSFIWHINHDYRPINNETTSENPSLSNRKEHPLFKLFFNFCAQKGSKKNDF